MDKIIILLDNDMYVVLLFVDLKTFDLGSKLVRSNISL